jgi:hypothetical protein
LPGPAASFKDSVVEFKRSLSEGAPWPLVIAQVHGQYGSR